MDEVIRSVLVERRLLSGGSDQLAGLWRFVLAFTPYALFLCEIVALNTCTEPACTYQGHDQSCNLFHIALIFIYLFCLLKSELS